MELTKTQKKQRLCMMLVGGFAIFFTGYPHVWSVYQPYVMQQAGWSQKQASLCFYLAMAFFVFGNIIGGRMQNKSSPKQVLLLGGGIFTAGVLLSAFLLVPSPLPIYLTYGVLQGIGQGMVYTVILATAQKWFPKRTGFASGVVVTANGLCGFFLAPISRSLLEAGGPRLAFLVIGIGIAVSWISCSIFFFVPPTAWYRQTEPVQTQKSGSAVAAQKQYTAFEMMHTKRFYLLLATMLFGLLSYFMISPISQTYQLALGIPSSIAVSAVTLGSIANASTRLVLPALSDRVGRIGCVKGVLLVCLFAMALLCVSRSYVVTGAIVLIYGCYGGIMGSFPSFTGSIFGIEHAGENYGYVMFGIVIATIGAPMITGAVMDSGYGMPIVFALGTAFAAIAFLNLLLLQRELKKIK